MRLKIYGKREEVVQCSARRSLIKKFKIEKNSKKKKEEKEDKIQNNEEKVEIKRGMKNGK